MMVSELIEKLVHLQKQHGNLEVRLAYDDNCSGVETVQQYSPEFVDVARGPTLISESDVEEMLMGRDQTAEEAELTGPFIVIAQLSEF